MPEKPTQQAAENAGGGPGDSPAMVRHGEWLPLALSGGYFFCVLAGYYCVRSVRESMGVEGGWDRLAWLMTATLAAMFLANPAFAAVVLSMPGRPGINGMIKVCMSETTIPQNAKVVTTARGEGVRAAVLLVATWLLRNYAYV